MSVGCIIISFDEDASPNGAEGFKSWLKGMIDFHLPNMEVVIQIDNGVDPLQILVDRIWAANKGRKITAIKDLRATVVSPKTGLTMSLKEAKDLMDAAEMRNP
jgi:hypothetical protein